METIEENHNVEPGQECWLPVPSVDGNPLTRKKVELYSLVLDSISIPCCVNRDGSSWQLLVPETHLDRVLNELRIYEEKNRNWPPKLPPARTLIENTLPTISVLILLATFYNLTQLNLSLPGHGFIDLRELGQAHSASILSGQWWRLVTALTLHSGLVHLAGNLVLGGIVVIFLCRELGSGLSWSLLLGTGILGNLANAIAQSPDHRSVGASTAVFGAVGILAAISMIQHRHQRIKRWLVPVAAGLALLALLGTEGKQTDLGAHLFGFVFGFLLGTLTELMIARHGRPGRLLNALLALTSAAVVVTAWWIAIELGG